MFENSSVQNVLATYNSFNRFCSFGRLSEVERLIKESADPVDLLNNEVSDPPLILAASNEHWDVCHLLLKSGANPSCKNRIGFTPLHIFAEKNQLDLIQETLALAGAYKDNRGQSPLYVAVKSNHLEAVKIFLEHGVDPTSITFNKDTTVHQAARNNNEEMLELLASAKAALTIENNMGETPSSLSTPEFRSKLDHLSLTQMLAQPQENDDSPSDHFKQTSESGSTPAPADTKPKRRILKA